LSLLIATIPFDSLNPGLGVVGRRLSRLRRPLGPVPFRQRASPLFVTRSLMFHRFGCCVLVSRTRPIFSPLNRRWRTLAATFLIRLVFRRISVARIARQPRFRDDIGGAVIPKLQADVLCMGLFFKKAEPPRSPHLKRCLTRTARGRAARRLQAPSASPLRYPGASAPCRNWCRG
jgi:hypothetical protein